MRRNPGGVAATSQYTTFRDVVGPGTGLGPCPDQHLGGVVGSYIPASTHGNIGIPLGVRDAASGIKRWFDSGIRRADPIINSSLELFSGLPVAETNAIAKHLSVVDMAENRILGRQGQRCRKFTVIVSGQVGLSRDGMAVGLFGPGCWFGCLALLGWAGDNNRLVTASALSDVRLATANEREFAALTVDFPELGDRIFRMAHRRLGYVHKLQAEQKAHQHVEHHDDYPIHLLAS